MSVQLGTRHVAEVRYRRCIGVGIYVITASGKKRGVFLPENCWRQLTDNIHQLNNQIEHYKGKRYTYGEPTPQQEAAICNSYWLSTQSADYSTNQLCQEVSTRCETGSDGNETKDNNTVCIQWGDIPYTYTPQRPHEAAPTNYQESYWSRQPPQGSQINWPEYSTKTCTICKNGHVYRQHLNIQYQERRRNGHNMSVVQSRRCRSSQRRSKHLSIHLAKRSRKWGTTLSIKRRRTRTS